jgi:carboxymethylenebutenolidase
VTEIGVRTEDGWLDARLFVPPGSGSAPLVVYYADALGLRPATTAMAMRLVGEGYAVLQPNLFYRSPGFAPFDPETVWSDPPERDRLRKIMGAVKYGALADETARLVDAIPDPRVRTERFATIGYCMGGRAAFVVSCALGERVAACAPIHAGGLVGDGADSPHHAANQLRARLYLGVADNDGSCTAIHQQVLRETLDSAGVRYELDLYATKLHGFAVPDFPVYDPDAAERHWQKVLALFRTALRAG